VNDDDNNENITAVVMTWLQALYQDFFTKGFNALVSS
jgi:hypothetical protein